MKGNFIILNKKMRLILRYDDVQFRLEQVNPSFVPFYEENVTWGKHIFYQNSKINTLRPQRHHTCIWIAHFKTAYGFAMIPTVVFCKHTRILVNAYRRACFIKCAFISLKVTKCLIEVISLEVNTDSFPKTKITIYLTTVYLPISH